MSNSPLVTYTKISPNRTVSRGHAIDIITPHCVVGQLTIEALGAVFADPARQASSNYGIDKDARVGMFCEEKDRSWCTGGEKNVNGFTGRDNDFRAVTIECASDTKDPYAFKDIVYEKLIELCADICKRNSKTKLLWIDDAKQALSHKLAPSEMLLTVHRWFAYKECPGDWLYERMGDLAEKVNAKLLSEVKPPSEEVKKESKYFVQVGAYSELKSAEDVVAKLKVAGFNAIIKEANDAIDQDSNWVPKVGDVVMFDGDKHFSSANSSAGFKCSKGKATITQIYQLGKSKHPYHLRALDGAGPYGWVDAGTFTKL